MSSSKHSDIEMEILLLGKWRFNTSSEKITIEFRDDMTYVQTRIQTLLFSKPKELITGTKFTGMWYVSHQILYLNVKSMPNSFLNIKAPLHIELSLADIVATVSSVFMPEDYEVRRINKSQFLLKDKKESIIGTKISH
ncbi:MAG: hypothetical protein EAZ76_06735 [Nostocales cyanobacterium]|nr:MAG: hypothetical protein EAZ87_22230 [Nostocales cyanobacterium]TAF16814.1 MAG: hypothetical protein EAZ76_06735 [Nostocales cyanobacterium]